MLRSEVVLVGSRLEKLAYLRWAVLLAGFLSACGPSDGDRRYRLFGGEELVLRGAPRRVVAANAGCAEYLLDLLEPERIAALPAEIFEYAARPPERASWPETRLLARYESEAVLAHAPDLVLVTPWQPAEVGAALRRAGVPVLIVPEVRELEEAREILLFLGRIFEREPRAQELWRELERRAAALRERAPQPAPKVLPYANLGDGGWTAGTSTTLDFALRLAGCENLAASAGFAGHARIDLEAVAHLAPEWIAISTEESASGPSATLAALRSSPVTASLPALRAERVLRLPPRLAGSTTHHVIDAAEMLREAVAR
ncbi:MAG: ABC transporter substrate-binding protein [Planctomycetes bacterium]|nr:ABC transporter substrate-binding protein [Planctomycetota bacterium]